MTTTISQRQDIALVQQSSYEALVLSYLDDVNGLLRAYAASARLDYDDLRQEAALTIMHCLELQPDRAGALHGYIRVAVRNRIIDKIRYNQSRRAVSLDALLGAYSAFSDLFPSDEPEPETALVTREELQALCVSLFSGKACLLAPSTRRMCRELAETALASLSGDSQEVMP
jgi:DNA-directed RNA polymerase specialized sigma24 family protein